MSRDFLCPCGKEKWEYRNCSRADCFKRSLRMSSAAAGVMDHRTLLKKYMDHVRDVEGPCDISAFLPTGIVLGTGRFNSAELVELLKIEEAPAPTSAGITNHRALLKKYMDHVGNCEGVTFQPYEHDGFSLVEVTELAKIDEELN